MSASLGEFFCAVCLEDHPIVTEKYASEGTDYFPCSHFVCDRCYDALVTNTCPTCRQILPKKEVPEDQDELNEFELNELEEVQGFTIYREIVRDMYGGEMIIGLSFPEAGVTVRRAPVVSLDEFIPSSEDDDSNQGDQRVENYQETDIDTTMETNLRYGHGAWYGSNVRPPRRLREINLRELNLAQLDDIIDLYERELVRFNRRRNELRGTTIRSMSTDV
uniref:ORF65 n=1 Tax=Malaco herpesvirus 1 TaxID=3031797 RepID=A0AA48SFG7_9VIRU|nr:TPA_asm: ORF65 [Malaco herpesvirus 1]